MLHALKFPFVVTIPQLSKPLQAIPRLDAEDSGPADAAITCRCTVSLPTKYVVLIIGPFCRKERDETIKHKSAIRNKKLHWQANRKKRALQQTTVAYIAYATVVVTYALSARDCLSESKFLCRFPPQSSDYLLLQSSVSSTMR